MASDWNSFPTPAVQALERLGMLSLRRVSMDDLLQTTTDLAKTVMPGRPETSVSLLVRDRPSTMASTGQLATDLDESQYDRGHGPCLHTARSPRCHPAHAAALGSELAAGGWHAHQGRPGAPGPLVVRHHGGHLQPRRSRPAARGRRPARPSAPLVTVAVPRAALLYALL